MFLFGHITHPKMTEPSSADFVMSEDKEILVFSQILSLNSLNSVTKIFVIQ